MTMTAASAAPRNPTALLAALLVGAVSLLLALPATASPSNGPRLSKVTGAAKVRSHRGQPWRPAQQGQRLRLSQSVSCDEACAVDVGDATIELASATVVQVLAPEFLRLPGRARSAPCSTIGLERGGVTVSVTGASSSPVAVRLGPSLQVVVGDGRAEVRASSTGAVVAPANAEVLLRRGKRWTELAAAELVQIDADGSLSPRSRIAAPRWTGRSPHHRPVALAADEPRSDVSLAWSAAPEATAYRLVVTEAAGGHGVVTRRRLSAERHHATVSLSEGSYLASVQAADGDGFWSERSEPLPVRVVRVALPDGGSMPDAATLVLPDTSQLRLLDPAGLEVAMQRRSFIQARRDLTYRASRGDTLRLRLAGQPDTESTIRLERRALHAVVELTPLLPVWPDDSIEARVRLVDPSGRTDPASVEPRISVSLGRQPLLVDFTEQDGVWTAKIHGRPIAGPQVLRVEVEDRAGVPLGESFVELVADAR